MSEGRRVTADDLAEVDGPYHVYLVNITELGHARFPNMPVSARAAAAVQDELNRHGTYDFQTGYGNPWNANEMILVMRDPGWVPRRRPSAGIEEMSPEDRAESARRSRRADRVTERQLEAWQRRSRT